MTPLAWRDADDQVRLGRMTDWREEDGAVLPAGQKLLLVDGEEFPSLIRLLAKDYGAKFPPAVRSGQVIDTLPETGYVVCSADSERDGPLELWLRLESVDSVEVRLLRADLNSDTVM